MPITRTFLDWNRPALPAVVDFLVSQYGILGVVDLENVVVVVPGRRAGRRLLELLVERTQNQHTPPTILTAGELPELLYEPQRPFAGDLAQKLAWVRALRNTARDEIEQVIPDPPADEEVERWLALGELLQSQHRELAADALDFADVAKLGGDLDAFDESRRWNVLRGIQRHYLDELDKLELWDKQTARLSPSATESAAPTRTLCWWARPT